MTLVEVMVASLLLAIAAAGLLGSFDAGRKGTSYSEMHNVANAIAEREVLRLTALPWAQIANNETHEPKAESTSSTDPSSYIKSGECAEGKVLPRHKPCYEYDWKGTKEPLVLAPESVVKEAENEAGEKVLEDPRSFTTLTASKATRLTGKIYYYVTWVNDEKCKGEGCTSSSAESSANYKRLTVAVTITGMKQPVVLSTLYVNPAGSAANALVAGAVCTEKGSTVPCTY
jgi:hypothetical protein